MAGLKNPAICVCEYRLLAKKNCKRFIICHTAIKRL